MDVFYLHAWESIVLFLWISQDNGKEPVAIRFLRDRHIFDSAAFFDRTVHPDLDSPRHLWQRQTAFFKTDVVIDTVCRVGFCTEVLLFKPWFVVINYSCNIGG